MRDYQLSLREHLQGIRKFYAWKAKLLRSTRLPDDHHGGVTAYVGAFKRPQNIHVIIESLLRAPSIGKILVSENMPRCLSGWLRDYGSRVTVLHYDTPQSSASRYQHLRDVVSTAFLIVDDDLFLEPMQIEMLCEALQKNLAVPHGIIGQEWTGTELRSGIFGSNRSVDVLNRVYAFTNEHLNTCLQLTEKLKTSALARLWAKECYCDLVLSSSGNSTPQIHVVGEILDCTSQGRAGTALWREQDFFEDREQCFLALSELRHLNPQRSPSSSKSAN
jgi:hypothetical protein